MVILICSTHTDFCIVINQHFICCDVVLIISPICVGDIEICQGRNACRSCRACCHFFHTSDPSEELISITGWRRHASAFCVISINRNSLVDRHVLSCGKQIAAIVIPIQESFCFFVFLDINGLQLYFISIGFILIKLIFCYNVAVFIRDLRIVNFYNEGISREYFFCSIFISSSIPLLDNPVTEYEICICRFSCSAYDCFCQIHIIVLICRCVCTS